MTIVNDEVVINDAGAQGNWTASGFDSPQDNSNASAVEIYREGTICQEWVLKENITDGYADQGTTDPDCVAGGVFVVWFFVTSDADLNKLSELWFQVSTSTSNITAGNWAAWDMKQKILDLDLYGWFPVVVYPTDATGNQPDETSTTHITDFTSTGGQERSGIRATTGGTGTKQTAFDQHHSISYVGGHSEDVTLTDLKTNNDTNDLGVVFNFGDFFKFQVNIRLGGGTTTNMTFQETNKTLFFDNERPAHNLGFIFVDNTSGTNTFDLDGWGITWNEQDSADSQAEIFTDPQHCDIFRINASSFARGGQFECRAWISDANTFVTNNSITNCDRVDPDSILFTGNTINDTRATGATTGALLMNVTAHRISACTFNKGAGASHAIVITVAGTYAFTDLTFVGYNAVDENADSVVRNESAGAVVINVTGGSGTVSVQNGASATTTVNLAAVTTLVHVADNTGADLQNARVYLAASDGTGDLPFQDSVTIARAGTVATVTHTAHGLATGDKVNIDGITDKTEDNAGVHDITVTTVNAYTYVTTDSGSTSYTGTIVSTGVSLEGNTDVNGDISVSKAFSQNQPVTGNVRKATASPRFKPFSLAGNTINSSTGLTVNVRMVLDE